MWHGVDAHSLMLLSQCVPVKPGMQRHSYELTPSTHDSYWNWTHGSDWHSSMLMAQFAPVKPEAQSHVYVLTPSIHVAPFWQGSPAQLSTSTEHVVPE